jgi:hypothetical protein
MPNIILGNTCKFWARLALPLRFKTIFHQIYGITTMFIGVFVGVRRALPRICACYPEYNYEYSKRLNDEKETDVNRGLVFVNVKKWYFLANFDDFLRKKFFMG